MIILTFRSPEGAAAIAYGNSPMREIVKINITN
jgi:hypothetical protein